MTGSDLDWEGLRALWDGGQPASPDRVAELTLAVRRQHSRLRWVLAGEILLTVAMLGMLAALWVTTPGPRMTTLGTFALVHTILVWTLVLRARRGLWTLPVAGPVREALAARVKHLAGRRRALELVGGLCLVELVAVPGLLWWLQRVAPARPGFAPSLAALAVLVAVLAWIAWEHRRVGREQARLTALARELDGGP